MNSCGHAVALAVLLLAVPASAALRPSFFLDHSAQIRDLWQTTPALADFGDGQIAKACNTLLERPSTTHE